MRVIRKQCEHGKRQDEENAVNNGSWKKLSWVQDDSNVHEERLNEADDTHQEVYDSGVDMSTSTDDKDCHKSQD